MAKWSEIPIVERELSDIRETVDRLEEINRLQAQTIERQAEELRRAQQILRNARDAALEEAGAMLKKWSQAAYGAADRLEEAGTSVRDTEPFVVRGTAFYQASEAVRSLKSTTQERRSGK